MEWLLEAFVHMKARCIGEGAHLSSLEVLKSGIAILLGTLIFFNPFPHTTSVREICFYLPAAMMLILMILRKVTFSFRSPLWLPLILFTFWSIISTVFALDVENSIHDLYSHLIRHILFYVMMIYAFSSRRMVVRLSWIMVLSAAILSAGTIGYFYFLLGNSFSDRLINFDQLPCNRSSLVAGVGMVFALFLLFTSKMRWPRQALLALCVLALLVLMILTQTRGTLVALFVGLVLLFFRHVKVIAGFLIVMAIVVGTTPIKNRLFDMGTSHPRISTHYRSLEILKDYPVSGIGFGMQIYGRHPLLSPEKYMSRIPTEYRQYEFFSVPHNMLMSIAVRTGLFGFGLFLYLLAAFVYMCWKLIRNGKDRFTREWGLCTLSAFVLFCVAGLFEPVFNHGAETILFVLMAMGTILWRINEESGAEMPENP